MMKVYTSKGDCTMLDTVYADPHCIEKPILADVICNICREWKQPYMSIRDRINETNITINLCESCYMDRTWEGK
jgi:hypothetical protein